MFEHVSLMTLDSLLKCIFGMTEGNVQLEGSVVYYYTDQCAIKTIMEGLLIPNDPCSILHKELPLALSVIKPYC